MAVFFSHLYKFLTSKSPNLLHHRFVKKSNICEVFGMKHPFFSQKKTHSSMVLSMMLFKEINLSLQVTENSMNRKIIDNQMIYLFIRCCQKEPSLQNFNNNNDLKFLWEISWEFLILWLYRSVGKLHICINI
jgi:hypothetical protein